VEKCQGIPRKFKVKNTDQQQKYLPHKGSAMLQRQPGTRQQDRSPRHCHLPGVTLGRIGRAHHAGTFIGTKNRGDRFTGLNRKLHRNLDQATTGYDSINCAGKKSNGTKYQQAENKNFYVIFGPEGYFLVLYKNYI